MLNTAEASDKRRSDSRQQRGVIQHSQQRHQSSPSVFKSGELDRGSTVAKFATVRQEGAREVERKIDYFNLDAIISVGYRVNFL